MLLMWCFHVKSCKPTMFEILSRKKRINTYSLLTQEPVIFCGMKSVTSQFCIEMKMSGQFVWDLKVCSVVFDLY